jgi:hypothetical protein
MTVAYDELDPGIRQVVRWLNDNGFDTTDSGDGKTKFVAENPMECAQPFPNVAIETTPATLVSQCDRLAALLREKGIEVRPMGWDGPEEPGLVNFQGFYDPSISTDKAYIALTGLDDQTLVGA